MDDAEQERIARNDATFRAANERLRTVAEEQRITELVPFLCECPDPRCTQVILVPLATYERVRGDGRQFIDIRGHEASAVGEIVEEHDSYVIVRKTGRAAEVAQELDPRG